MALADVISVLLIREDLRAIKIADLSHECLEIKQHVARVQVPVRYVLAVEIGDRPRDLIDYEFEQNLRGLLSLKEVELQN